MGLELVLAMALVLQRAPVPGLEMVPVEVVVASALERAPVQHSL